MRRPQYEYGQAATLRWYPLESELSGSTAITSATYGLFSGQSSALIAAGTAATVDAASQTVSSVSRGDRTLTVSSTSAFAVDGRYWLCSDSGRGYYVDVADLTATTLTLRDPVRFAISSGKVSGALITGALSSTVAENLERNLRLEWSYVIGGVTFRKKQIVDIVRWPFDVDITEDDVERVSTQFGELVGQYGSWRALREGAIDSIWSDLRAANREPDKIADRSVLKLAAAYKVLQLRSIGDLETFTQLGDLYNHELANAINDRNQWYDTDGDMTVDSESGGTGDEDELSGGPPTYIGVG